MSRVRERQKRLHFAAEERKMQAYLQLERDRLFQEERRKEANPEAHPYSGMYLNSKTLEVVYLCNVIH